MCQCAEEEPGTIVVVNWPVSCLQGITNTLALPIDKMLYIYRLRPHSPHQKNPFQSEQFKQHFHQRNWFTNCETGSNKVKLPKVGSNAIVRVGAGRNKGNKVGDEVDHVKQCKEQCL
jgi:hypothetical protein